MSNVLVDDLDVSNNENPGGFRLYKITCYYTNTYDDDADDEVDWKLKLWRMKGLKVSVPTLCFNDSYHNKNHN